MHGIVRSFCLLLSLQSLLCALEVIEFIPALTSTLDTRQITVKGPVRLICKGANFTWQFEEGLDPPDGVTESVTDDAQILDIELFDESMDGLYSCLRYETKKRMHLYFYDNVIPDGFHKCNAEERSKCYYRIKDCIASDISNETSCLCMQHWSGPRCDISEYSISDLLPRKSMPTIIFESIFVCTIFVGILAGIIGLIVLIVVTCKNRRTKSECEPASDPEPLMLPLMLR